MRHETTYSITYQPIMNAYSFSVQTVSSLKMKLLIAFPDIKQSFRYTVKTQILILKNKLWLGKYFKDALKRVLGRDQKFARLHLKVKTLALTCPGVFS